MGPTLAILLLNIGLYAVVAELRRIANALEDRKP